MHLPKHMAKHVIRTHIFSLCRQQWYILVYLSILNKTKNSSPILSLLLHAYIFPLLILESECAYLLKIECSWLKLSA
jgi:hypothetical protein